MYIEPTVLRHMSVTQRYFCILFADVAGTALLSEKLGPAEAAHAVERCHNRMSRATEACQGRVVKIGGDEMMAVFNTAEQALHAAYEMQERVHKLPPVSGVTLSIRVGMQYGPALEEGGDFFGDAVNVAASIIGVARGGQIVTTEYTLNALSQAMRQAARQIDGVSIPVGGATERVFEIVWQETPEFATWPTSQLRRPAVKRLLLRHGAAEFVLDMSHDRISLGRDAASDVVIHDRRASRSHARIERRQDRFILIDQSTNGTFVTFDGELELALKSEEIVLHGRGRLSFGHAYSDDISESVTFEVST